MENKFLVQAAQDFCAAFLFISKLQRFNLQNFLRYARNFLIEHYNCEVQYNAGKLFIISGDEKIIMTLIFKEAQVFGLSFCGNRTIISDIES